MCPGGETCWTVYENMQPVGYRCRPAGPGQVGGSCLNTANDPTCGTALTCLQVPTAPEGVCTPFCDPTDPKRACPQGQVCTKYILKKTSYAIHACAPMGAGGGGGSGGGAGSMASAGQGGSSSGVGGAGG